MLRTEDNDDDFILPQPGSRLATIFSRDDNPITDDSFKFKAPKDPNGKAQISEISKKPKAPPKTMLLCAFSGNCFKLVNGYYTEPQRLGVAVIGEVHNNLYSILLYVTKEKPVSFTRVTRRLNVEVEKGNFVCFTDDISNFWSVTFAKEEEVLEFAKQIVLAKWMSGDGNGVLGQDLSVGDGPPVGVGDLVEIRVKFFRLVTEGVLILEPLNEKTDLIEKLKLGKKGNSRVLEDAVTGMRKLGRRLIIYSKDEQDGNEKSCQVAAEEIILVRVKFIKGRDGTKDIIPAYHGNIKEGTQSPPPLMVEQSASNSDVKTTPANRQKAKLMTRIKKIGQPLPLSRSIGRRESVPDEDEFSEEQNVGEIFHDSTGQQGDEVVLSQVMIKPDIRPKPRDSLHSKTQNIYNFNPNSYSSPSNTDFQLAVQTPSFTNFSPYMSTSGVYPTQTSSVFTDPGISFLMIEMKQQNLDLRSVLMRTSDKVDILFSKMEDLQKSYHSISSLAPTAVVSSQSSNVISSISSTSTLPLPHSEVNNIMQGVEKLFKDNEVLRRELKEKDSKIEILNGKLNDLYEDNHRWMKSRSDEKNPSQVDVKTLQDENVALKRDFNELNGQLETCQRDLDMANQTLSERSNQVKELTGQLGRRGEEMERIQGEINMKSSAEKAKMDGEVECLRRILTDKENQLKVEEETHQTKEQHMKLKFIENDRTISQLRETLMKKQDVTDVHKSVVEETVREYTERLAIQEEFHAAMTKSWEEEKCNFLNKMSEIDRVYQTKLQGVLNQKNIETEAVKEDVKKLTEQIHEMEKSYQSKVQGVIQQKNSETEVIKDELKKLSDEYHLVKTLAKELKEKYDWTIEQHQVYIDQTDSRIKSFMNNVYRCFKENMSHDRTYHSSEVLSMASSIIRNKTLEMLATGNVNQNNDQILTSSNPSPNPSPNPPPNPPPKPTPPPSRGNEEQMNESNSHTTRSLGDLENYVNNDIVGPPDGLHVVQSEIDNGCMKGVGDDIESNIKDEDGPLESSYGNTSNDKLSTDDPTVDSRVTNEDEGAGISTNNISLPVVGPREVSDKDGSIQPIASVVNVNPTNENPTEISSDTTCGVDIEEDASSSTPSDIVNSKVKLPEKAAEGKRDVNDNDDDIGAKPPPFPDTDEEDDWSV